MPGRLTPLVCVHSRMWRERRPGSGMREVVAYHQYCGIEDPGVLEVIGVDVPAALPRPRTMLTGIDRQYPLV